MGASHADAFVQVIKKSDMEERKEKIKNKGGRPVKADKRNRLIGVKCTLTERFIIEGKANAAGLTLSEFLRISGLNSKIDILKKALPKEVLKAIADLNHMAANLNQIAKKRNSFDELNALDRAELSFTVGQLKQFVNDFKNYFQ